MKRLYPMTQKEQDFAVEHFALVADFLSFHQLPENEYYDVVIFGYMEAVQKQCRNPVNPEQQNFTALARICMKSAFCREVRDRCREKRNPDRPVFSLDTPLSDSEDSTLHNLLADVTQNPEKSSEAKDLLERAFSVATPDERRIAELYAIGYTLAEIAGITGFRIKQVVYRLQNFREKARSYWTTGEALNKKAQYIRNHHDEFCAKERARWAANKEVINARRRARTAAKKAASNVTSIENGPAT